MQQKNKIAPNSVQNKQSLNLLN